MPRVTFTSNLQRHLACPPETVAARTVAEALQAYFARHPQVRAYVLDEQGALRQHAVVFVDGGQLRDRARQQDALGEAVDGSGERLACGSTTGSLGVSENGATRGSTSPRTCRPSTRCASPEGAPPPRRAVRGGTARCVNAGAPSGCTGGRAPRSPPCGAH